MGTITAIKQSQPVSRPHKARRPLLVFESAVKSLSQHSKGSVHKSLCERNYFIKSIPKKSFGGRFWRSIKKPMVPLKASHLKTYGFGGRFKVKRHPTDIERTAVPSSRRCDSGGPFEHGDHFRSKEQSSKKLL